jgi:solute carrier family 25 (mitochondrial dicarboxylate transporter), member 10
MQGNRNNLTNSHQYKGLLDAFKTIIKNEKVTGLYKGWKLTSIRASIYTGFELASYDQIKTLLIKNRICDDTIYAHFLSSFLAGFIASFFGSPIVRFLNKFLGCHQ